MEPNVIIVRLGGVEGTKVDALHEPDSGMSFDVSSQAAGPVLAFEDFYRAQNARIRKALQISLGDPELAEDALNEGMARALQRWKRVARFENSPGWVYRVAMNWATSWLRRRQLERNRPIATSQATAELSVADDELRMAVDGLSVEHRTVVVCRYFFDWSVRQTAESLNIPEGTVKSRLSRALDNIRSEMEDQDE